MSANLNQKLFSAADVFCKMKVQNSALLLCSTQEVEKY